MILTTTPNIEGFKIIDYKGLVSGVAVKQKKTKVTLSEQKIYDAFKKDINTTKEEALQTLKNNAKNLKANAVVGINIDFEITTHSYITITATGTAVQVKV